MCASSGKGYEEGELGAQIPGHERTGSGERTLREDGCGGSICKKLSRRALRERMGLAEAWEGGADLMGRNMGENFLLWTLAHMPGEGALGG